MLHLGIAFRCLGRYDEANQALLKAVDAKSDYALAYSELGYTALAEGNYSLAERYLFTSYELDNSIPITYLYSYILNIRLGNEDEAEKAIANLRDLP